VGIYVNCFNTFKPTLTTFLLTKPLFWDSLKSHFFVFLKKKKKEKGKRLGYGYKGIRGQRALGRKAHNNTHEDSWAR
jgi:hypothetical protein